MPLYEYQCETCNTASNGSRSSRIPSSTSARRAARDGAQAASRRRRSSSRVRLLHHRLREEVVDRRGLDGSNEAAADKKSDKEKSEKARAKERIGKQVRHVPTSSAPPANTTKSD